MHLPVLEVRTATTKTKNLLCILTAYPHGISKDRWRRGPNTRVFLIHPLRAGPQRVDQRLLRCLISEDYVLRHLKNAEDGCGDMAKRRMLEGKRKVLCRCHIRETIEVGRGIDRVLDLLYTPTASTEAYVRV